MDVVFQKLSCLGNDIHSLLWKLGSLYLFILATNLFQVNCGFITHLLLSIIDEESNFDHIFGMQ